MLKTRDPVFDIIKGFLIVMVIVGHLRTGRLGLLVYSFHLPIFFMIAGYFYKPRDLLTEIAMDSKRLLLPYCFASVVIVIIAFIRYYLGGVDEIFKNIFCVLWGSGRVTREKFFGFYLWTAPTWFLMAMFWARLIFNYISKVKSLSLAMFISISLSIIAIEISSYADVPFSLLPGICGVSFMLVGYMIKEYDLLKNAKILPYAIICWFVMISMAERMDVNFCRYVGFFVLDLLGSLGAFFIIHAFVDSVLKRNSNGACVWRNMFEFLGKYCLVVLVIHSIEFVFLQTFWRQLIMQFSFCSFVGSFSHVVVAFLRLALVLSLTYGVSKIEFLKKNIFGIE